MISNSSKYFKSIMLNGADYPVYVDGGGAKPCLCIGIGSLMQKTLSSDFKKVFTTYSTDLYWIQKNRLAECSVLSMAQIIADINSVIAQLGLEKPVILAHSAFGIVALELAKDPAANISGIIMVGSPPAWNDSVITFARKYFDKHASVERKENDKIRKEKFSRIRKPGESDISINAYEADSARYWGNFNIERAFLDDLWNGIDADDEMMNHFFFNILPQHHSNAGMENIIVPVLLAAGQLDYDCVPLLLWEQYPKPRMFTLLDCGEVGHWPNLENVELFDAQVKKWSDSF